MSYERRAYESVDENSPFLGNVPKRIWSIKGKFEIAQKTEVEEKHAKLSDVKLWCCTLRYGKLSSDSSYPIVNTVIILNRGSMRRKRTGIEWRIISIPEYAMSQRDVTRDFALIGQWPYWEGGWGRSMYSAFPGNCSVSYLSFIYGRSKWAELNGGENSLHWKANMLPLFSIMTFWLWSMLSLVVILWLCCSVTY